MLQFVPDLFAGFPEFLENLLLRHPLETAVLLAFGLGILLTWAVFALSRRSAGSLAYDV